MIDKWQISWSILNLLTNPICFQSSVNEKYRFLGHLLEYIDFAAGGNVQLNSFHRFFHLESVWSFEMKSIGFGPNESLMGFGLVLFYLHLLAFSLIIKSRFKEVLINYFEPFCENNL